jgi:hypothetical protein
VLLVGLGAHHLLCRHRCTLAARCAALPPAVRAALEAHATESLLLLVVGGGATAAWLSEGLYSTMLLGAFTVGAVLCTTPVAYAAYAEHVLGVQMWLSRLFFGATVAFVVPLGELRASHGVTQHGRAQRVPLNGARAHPHAMLR